VAGGAMANTPLAKVATGYEPGSKARDALTHADVQVNAGGARLDPHGMIRKPLLDAALKAMDRHAGRITRKDAIYLVDVSIHSSKPRLFRLDLKSGQVRAYRTAHGLGSDRGHTGYARTFSNVPGSAASSLGAYVTAGQSVGARDGANVLLDGLDPT